MHIVWHGNYLKFFEDGREALGAEFKLDYLTIAHNGTLVPIVRSEIDHLATIGYGDRVKVVTKLIDSPAAKIIHEYQVYNLTNNKLAARGKTIQAFVDKSQQLLITIPDFYAEWKASIPWKTEEK